MITTVQGATGKQQAAIATAAQAYAKANPNVSTASNIDLALADGSTVRGSMQNLGDELIFIVAQQIERKPKGEVPGRRERRLGKKTARRAPSPEERAVAGAAAAESGDTPQSRFNQMKALKMLRPAGTGWELAGRPVKKFASTQAVLDHFAAKMGIAVPQKKAAPAKKAIPARKAAKKAAPAKAAKKAARRK